MRKNISISKDEVTLNSLRISIQSQIVVVDTVAKKARELNGEFIITPNSGHLKELRTNISYKKAMSRAFYSLPDGWPLAFLASVILKRRIRRVTGSDLVYPLCKKAAESNLSVGFLGGRPGSTQRLTEILALEIPGIRITFSDPFPLELSNSQAFRLKICDNLNRQQPNILFVGIGCPKQEILANELLSKTKCGVIMCVGAGIDFLAGNQRRAPKCLQRLGLEWCYRLMAEPRRMFKRYLQATSELIRFVIKLLLS